MRLSALPAAPARLLAAAAAFLLLLSQGHEGTLHAQGTCSSAQTFSIFLLLQGLSTALCTPAMSMPATTVKKVVHQWAVALLRCMLCANGECALAAPLAVALLRHALLVQP
jgi:hypothetical protein